MTHNQSPLSIWITSAAAAHTHPALPPENDDIPVRDHAGHIIDLTRRVTDAPAPARNPLLTDLYAAAADLSDSILLPALLRSPHTLIGTPALDFKQDLHDHLAASANSTIGKLADADYPTDLSDPTPWQRWTVALCYFLINRADAHQTSVMLIAQKQPILEQSADQNLLNCYTVSTGIAAAARWAMAHSTLPA